MGDVEENEQARDRSERDEPVVPQITEKQARRLNTPVGAMVISVIALLGITLPFVWLQPRPDNQTYRPQVDLVQTAQQARTDAGFDVLAPELPADWHANFARWHPADDQEVPYWEFGAVTASGGFLTLAQTDRADPTWTAERIDRAPQTGTMDVEGTQWRRHSSTDRKTGETTVSAVGRLAGTTVVVTGDSRDEELKDLLSRLARAADGAGAAASASASAAP